MSRINYNRVVKALPTFSRSQLENIIHEAERLLNQGENGHALATSRTASISALQREFQDARRAIVNIKTSMGHVMAAFETANHALNPGVKESARRELVGAARERLASAGAMLDNALIRHEAYLEPGMHDELMQPIYEGQDLLKGLLDGSARLEDVREVFIAREWRNEALDRALTELYRRERESGDDRRFVYEYTLDYLEAGPYKGNIAKASAAAARRLKIESGVEVSAETARRYFYRENEKRQAGDL